MLIDFFYTLRAAKLPVSVKEFLTLLEALQAHVVGPGSDACSICRKDFGQALRNVRNSSFRAGSKDRRKPNL